MDQRGRELGMPARLQEFTLKVYMKVKKNWVHKVLFWLVYHGMLTPIIRVVVENLKIINWKTNIHIEKYVYSFLNFMFLTSDLFQRETYLWKTWKDNVVSYFFY